MRRLPLAALLACCLALVACSSQGDGAEAWVEPEETTDGDAEIGDSGVRSEESPPMELAMVSEALRLGLERPDSYLPAEVSLTDQSAVIISDLLYDGLTEAVGVAERLRPGLAEAWWHNADYTTWTFSLDPDRGVPTESVVNSLVRFTGAGDDATARPDVAARLAADIREVTATDQRTVVVELARPNAGLPWILSGLRFSIVGPAGEPTGGYGIVSDDSGGLRLASRLNGTDGPHRPVRIEWITDRQVGYRKLQDGKLHGSLVPDEAVDEAAVRFAIGPAASVSTSFYVLHLGSTKFSDPLLREATRTAIDRHALVAGGTFAQEVVPVDGLVPPTMAGFRPDVCPVCVGLEPSSLDMGAFGQLDPLEVAYSGADQQATAAEIVAQLEASGLPAKEQPMDPEELAAVIVAGETDIFSFGWVAAATSSDAVLPVLLAADSPANVARIGSAEIDRILAAAAVTADDQARWDLHHQAHQAALSSGRLIPVAATRTALAVAADAGVVAVRADGSIDLNGQ